MMIDKINKGSRWSCRTTKKIMHHWSFRYANIIRSEWWWHTNTQCKLL